MINSALVILGCAVMTREVNDSAAERRPDVADDPKKRDYMLRLNVQVPEFLGTLTKQKRILLIYISSGMIPLLLHLATNADNRLCI